MAMDLIGTRIGNFTLTRRLGQGGMGAVYLAEHDFIAHKKAVKVLSVEAARDPALVRRFFDEAVAASACQHEHIVTVEDCGNFRLGDRVCHYLVMEYLDGHTVGQACRPPHATAGRFEDAGRAARIAAYAAAALAHAHSVGIVHRDIKPENLFLARRGSRADYLKVLDFGIARLTGNLAPGMRTRTGAVLGTPEYMSPEQARGLHPDGKTDVWSLGVVLYRILAGRLPFIADTFTLLAVQITQAEPPRLGVLRPDLPPGLERAVVEALRKRAEDRPTMSELRELLLTCDAAPRPIGAALSLAEEVSYRHVQPSVPRAAEPLPPWGLAVESAPTTEPGIGPVEDDDSGEETLPGYVGRGRERPRQ